MYEYVKHHEFPAPERMMLGAEGTENLILGWTPDSELRKVREDEYDKYCLQCLDCSLHCVREALTRPTDLEGSQPSAYFWHMLVNNHTRIVKVVESTLENPVRETAETALKVCELVIRLSARLERKKITMMFAEVFIKWWNQFGGDNQQIVNELLYAVDRRNESDITATLRAMVDRWVKADERNELTKVQKSFGGDSNPTAPQVVDAGRLYLGKKRVYKVMKRDRFKGDLEEYQLFIFSDVLIWAQFSKSEKIYRFAKDERQTVLLAFCEIRDVPDDERLKYVFEIKSPQETVRFKTTDRREKIQLIEKLNSAIQQNKRLIRQFREEVKDMSTQLWKMCSSTSAFLGRSVVDGTMVNTSGDKCKLCLRKFSTYHVKKAHNRCPACDAYVCEACHKKNKLTTTWPPSSKKKKVVCDCCYDLIEGSTII